MLDFEGERQTVQRWLCQIRGNVRQIENQDTPCVDLQLESTLVNWSQNFGILDEEVDDRVGHHGEKYVVWT